MNKRKAPDGEPQQKTNIRFLIKMYLEDLGIMKQLSQSEQFDREHRILFGYRHMFTDIQWTVNMVWMRNSGSVSFPIPKEGAIKLEVSGGKRGWMHHPDLRGSIHVKTNVKQKQINSLEWNRITIVYIPLVWYWEDPDSEPEPDPYSKFNSAHSTLLVVNTRTRRYYMFDPNDGSMHVFDRDMPNNTLKLNRYSLLEAGLGKFSKLVHISLLIFIMNYAQS